MISTNSDSRKSSGSDVFSAPGTVASERSTQYRQTENTYRWHLDRVVEQIESAEVRAIVRTVFKDLSRLLECLSLIESHLRHVQKAQETLTLFHLIHDETRSLLEFIRTDALNVEALTDELKDTLDGICFALGHDLRRVFDNSSAEANAASATHAVLSQVHRAHDVLTNCLQQSTVSLAVVFDTNLVGAKLFNNSDARYQQSLQLCQDLLTLRQLVESFEENGGEVALGNLTAGLEKFRGESMECLMYSDWPQFESFCERVTLSTDDHSTLAPVLNQFQCYLEALLGQVRMRAVLTESSQTPFNDSHNTPSAPLSSSLTTEPEEAAWGPYAFAS